MKKRIAALTLILAMTLAMALAGCGDDATIQTQSSGSASASTPSSTSTVKPKSDALVLRFSGHSALGTPATEYSTALCDEVAEETDGALVIEYYPYHQLGDSLQVFDEVIMGTIDMAMCGANDSVCVLATSTLIPALATSYEDMEKLLQEGSYIDGVIGDALDAVGIKYLGTFFGGITGVATNKEAKAPADPTVSKGVTIRSPTTTTFQAGLDALGFRAVSLGYSEIFSSLQTGVIEGYGGGMPHTVLTSFSEVITHYYDYNICSEGLPMMISKKTWDEKLSQEYQNLLTDKFHKIIGESFGVYKAYEDDCSAQLREMGIEVVTFTDAERSAYEDHVREVAWPKLEDIYGKEFFDGLREAVA